MHHLAIDVIHYADDITVSYFGADLIILGILNTLYLTDYNIHDNGFGLGCFAIGGYLDHTFPLLSPR